MLALSTDRSPPGGVTQLISLQEISATDAASERRPTWWLDESEHARLLGVKPRKGAGASTAAKPKVSAKSPAEVPATATPKEDPAFADFAALTPTLAALDRILRPPASDVPGLAPRHRGDRIRRLGVAFGAAAVMAAVVFFR